MSHSALIIVELDKESQIGLLETCTNLKSHLNSLIGKINNQNIVNQLKENLVIIDETYSKVKNNQFAVYESLLHENEQELILSNLTKQLVNISFLTKEQINQLSDNYDFNVTNYILQYGEIALEALKKLKQKQSVIFEVDLANEIDSLLKEEASNETKLKFKLDCANIIKEVFPTNVEIQTQLMNRTQELKFNLELNDFKAYVMSKKRAMLKIKKVAKKINDSLISLNENYKQIGKSKIAIDENGAVKIIYKFGNKYRETFDISIDENLGIVYKIGDYERHCCSKTSEQIIKYLNKNGAKVVKFNVFREFELAKPKYKAIQKMNTKTKEVK
ncbi:UNVERIFIED_CONTAM: hypothetical protein O8I53_08295 [Campylobacter lari]